MNHRPTHDDSKAFSPWPPAHDLLDLSFVTHFLHHLHIWLIMLSSALSSEAGMFVALKVYKENPFAGAGAICPDSAEESVCSSNACPLDCTTTAWQSWYDLRMLLLRRWHFVFVHPLTCLPTQTPVLMTVCLPSCPPAAHLSSN